MAINHILVPTDGSEGSLKAAGLAGDLARATGARVSVLYVQSLESLPTRAWGPDAFKSMDQVRSALEKEAHETSLAHTIDALGDLETKAIPLMAWGQATSEISKFVAENSVDMVVMGSHGRSGLNRAFLGSVSQAVANQVSCPVTIVK